MGDVGVIVPGWLFVEIGNEPFWWVWTDSIGSLGFSQACTGGWVGPGVPRIRGL